MKKKTKILLLAFIVSLPSIVFGQTLITGKVTEAGTNAPLQGVTVAVKGTNRLTQTDADGKFSITIPNGEAKLVLTYVGYISQTVDAKNDLSVSLTVDNTKMSEVVVTGLASSVKRTNLANAVASVSGKELIGTTVQSTVDGALYG